MKRLLIPLSATALLLLPLLGYGDIFRWVGKDGVINFGDQPPAGVKATLIKTSELPKNSRPPATAVNNHQQIRDYLKRIERQNSRSGNSQPGSSNANNSANNRANNREPENTNRNKNGSEKGTSKKRNENALLLNNRTEQIKRYADQNTPQGRSKLKKTKKQRVQKATQKQPQRLNSKLNKNSNDNS
ncbi:MAG: DUF4124 domain-containing protein [Motiliproteus sp.]|nr:DUF4124 domain-containing protein [Motiliproteus sp.]MCW9053899.1 DUF4124 domain-containing protein [Motiliproteus sp.]